MTYVVGNAEVMSICDMDVRCVVIQSRSKQIEKRSINGFIVPFKLCDKPYFEQTINGCLCLKKVFLCWKL